MTTNARADSHNGEDALPPGRSPVGWALLLLAALHLLATPLFYGEAWSSIINGGVVGAVEAEPSLLSLRSAGFWYVVAGLALAGIGLDVRWIERCRRPVPAHVGWVVLVLGLVGTLLMPASPFWLFFLITVLVVRSRWRHASGKRGAAAT